ncbi:YpmS family protein [Bacillus sp. FJAT-47783]|uniref:YpmS family protein n=1 Tax=Bacillus sp. FJAT-47783 TaxID=2922712 RepID=UPI001FACC397|nr:YpmS family protein [Bacillus sp. FJAT-47783]
MRKWKIRFFTLLTINIAIILLLVLLVFSPVKKDVPDKVEVNEEEYATIHVQTNKETVTKLVNQYLIKEANNQPLSYEISIEENVKLYGTLPAFGRDLQLTISFIPRVTNEGDVVLTVHEMSVGKLALPISYVLKYIERHYELPKEVTIDAKKAQVFVKLTDISLQNDYKVKAGNINLEKDTISAELYIPYEYE